MIISDLTYLETVDSAQVKGGIGNFFSAQLNVSKINQGAVALAGNGSGIAIGNVAVAANVATPVQVNL